MSLLVLILACSSSGPTPPPQTPPTDPPAVESKPAPRAGPVVRGPVDGMPGVVGHITTVHVDGADVAVELSKVVASGEVYDGVVFGQTFDARGGALPWPDWMDTKPEGDRVCNVLDFGALLHNEHGWFHLAHSECTIGGVWVTPMAVDDAGLRRRGKPVPVDFSSVGGTTTNCAGDVTPWNTLLSSEEYEANARLALSDGRLPDEQMDMKTKHRFEWSFLNGLLEYQDTVHPYLYGWIPEVQVTGAEGQASVVKRYAMGRFSHEMAIVMPDERTVYLSDDQYHGTFFLFVADVPRDLSAGTLYASRWTQAEGSEMSIDWVSLGHASDSTIASAVERRVAFSELFDAAALSPDGTCPEGFGRTTHTWGTECLKTREPVLASRLESRRVAGLLGATTELSKSEGIAFDPDSNEVFLATSKINAGMLEESESRGPGDYRRSRDADHLKLDENPCGIVWRLRAGEGRDTDGAEIGSPHVMRSASVAIAGLPEGEKTCSEQSIANPDNIAFVDPYGWLVMAEDTSRHEHDVLWALDVRTPGAKPFRLAEVESASEVTGLHWSEVDGRGYLSMSNQWDPQRYPARRSVAALLGPFPVPPR